MIMVNRCPRSCAAGCVVISRKGRITLASEKDSYVPPTAVDDAIMESPENVERMLEWAMAVFTGEKEEDIPRFAPYSLLSEGNTPPFSFVYDGMRSANLLNRWQRSVKPGKQGEGGILEVSWSDPATGLMVTAIVKTFRRYPAVEWVLYFENGGNEDTPIIEDIQALDVSLVTPKLDKQVVLHQLHGDACNENSFLPFKSVIASGGQVDIAPTGGRPSSISAFPFMNLEYDDEGMIIATGWSGQWAMSIKRDGSAPFPTRIQAGMELTHLRLHPGEKIRSPRMLIMPWKGERMDAHNRFRRLMLFEYVPKANGRAVELPAFLQTFDRYNSRPGWATEAGQLDAVRFAHDAGCSGYWLDAAWFEGGFPNGVGNWYHRPADFPNGLKPVSDLCHKLGMKFVLWFEPERVAPGSKLAREHPEWVFGGNRGGLFKLNDPVARRWLTDLLSRRIEEYGVDIYRNDFNIDPLQFWRQHDEPDRQGITEIRYVEGHYEMWDELLARHPGLMIDNCASGGRRIDLETCMRSVPLWRSDTSCSAGHSEWNQMQACALGQYIPLHTVAGWTHESYDFRSAATAGVICQWDYLEEGFSVEAARTVLAEARENRRYWYGDIYPLTPVTVDLDVIAAYQLHRPDLDAGAVFVYRRPECKSSSVNLKLHGLSPAKTYTLEVIDDGQQRTRTAGTGRDLAAHGLDLELGAPGSSLLIRYETATDKTVSG